MAYVDPSITQMLKKLTNISTSRDIINNLRLKEKEYIFFPVNNSTRIESEEGSHWSMLLYKANEPNKGFSHYDPIQNSNHNHAKELANKLRKID